MLESVQTHRKGIIYLAGPYSHPDPRVREMRYQLVTEVAARIIARGRVVFSPLTMTHPIDLILAKENETLGSDYWVRFDESFMEFCSEMFVLKVDGWEQSSGVRREIGYFEARKRPIFFLDYENEIQLEDRLEHLI